MITLGIAQALDTHLPRPESESLAEHSGNFLSSLQRVMIPRTLENANHSMHTINAVIKFDSENPGKNSPPNFMHPA